MTGEGGLVEVQATAERTPLSRAHLDELLALAGGGIEQPARGPGAGDRRGAAASAATAAASVGAMRLVKLLLATHNEHKRREFARLLAAGRGGCELERCPTTVMLPPEDGETFAENALGKARAAAARDRAARAIADDSGIAAAALGGAPGVRSARYAGEHATDEQNLREAAARGAGRQRAGVRVRDRLRRSRATAPSACSRAAARGGWPSSRAASGGFGYDPAFLPDDGPPGLTMAELSRRAEGRDQPPRPRRARC